MGLQWIRSCQWPQRRLIVIPTSVEGRTDPLVEVKIGMEAVENTLNVELHSRPSRIQVKSPLYEK